ncbi:MAG: ribosome-associated translation inhibitor RaiA [Planctomycetota bacterium]
MDTTITGRHVTISDSLREYALSKANKLPHFYDRVNRVEIIADRHDSHSYRVEFVAHVDGHAHFVAHAHHDDLYAATDACSEKLIRQIHDYKAQRRDAKKHSPV